MDTRLNEILIIGAGGMGALFGAILSKGGLQVTLVDRDIEHVEAIRANGLHISGFGGDRLQQIVIETGIGAIKCADLVLVQCKATSTAEVAESLRPITASGAVFISFQNGLGNEEILSEILGAENVLGGLTSMAGAKLGPGHIRDFDRSPAALKFFFLPAPRVQNKPEKGPIPPTWHICGAIWRFGESQQKQRCEPIQRAQLADARRIREVRRDLEAMVRKHRHRSRTLFDRAADGNTHRLQRCCNLPGIAQSSFRRSRS